MQGLWLSFSSRGSEAVSSALSNIFFRFSCVNAEHSMYSTASRAQNNISAVCGMRGFFVPGKFPDNRRHHISEINFGSNKQGVFKQWWIISSTHFYFPFSEDHWKRLKICLWIAEGWFCQIFLALQDQIVHKYMAVTSNCDWIVVRHHWRYSYIVCCIAYQNILPTTPSFTTQIVCTAEIFNPLEIFQIQFWTQLLHLIWRTYVLLSA